MKYLVLLVDYAEGEPDWNDMDAEQQQSYVDKHDAFSAAVREQPGAEILSGEALAEGVTVLNWSADRQVVLSDGAYAEATEKIGGFYLMEVPDLDVLVKLCSVLPAYVMELRPVLDMS